MEKKVRNRTIMHKHSSSAYLYEENKINNLKRCMHFYVHCSIVQDSQDYGSNLGVHQHMNVQRGCGICGIYMDTHTIEYYSGIKNKTLSFVTTQMDLESIMLNKIR